MARKRKPTRGGSREGAGRKPLDAGERWRAVMLSLTPDRLATAQEIGDGHAPTGVYRLLDFARQNATTAAKARTAAADSTSTDR